jgi:hypothetical protein
MNEIDERYYKGYEGDSEIIFSMEENNGDKNEFGIWDGYFYGIMKQIKPKEGYWTGLAYYYHLDKGWYEESPWQVENIEEAYEQLSEIDKDKLEYPEEKEILDIILNMFREAIEHNYKMYISYE